MMRGISFRIPQEDVNMLWRILNCINIEKYKWYCIENQTEVWAKPESNECLFEKERYDGASFSKLINSKYKIIFLKLQAYYKAGKYYDIHTYQDFQESDCQLLLLGYDCEFIEIYSKDDSISKAIYENAVSNKFKDIEYITDDNDDRTGMDVL